MNVHSFCGGKIGGLIMESLSNWSGQQTCIQSEQWNSWENKTGCNYHSFVLFV